VTWADALAPLRERPFAWYFTSRFVNTLGAMMATVALTFAVLDLSGSATALGQVLAAHTVPMVLLLLYGGVLSDRFPREVVLQVSNAASALTQGAIAVLVLTGHAELWMLLVLSALHGAVSAVSLPAMASLLPQLVPAHQLQQANALASLTRNGLAVLGPSLGALLVVTVGSGWALAADAACWAASAALLVPVRVRVAGPAGVGPDTVRELREGWGFVRGTTWLWVVVLGFAVLNGIQTGALLTLGPVVAEETVGRQAWGYVLSAQAVGLLVTSVVLLRVRLPRPLLLGMLGMSLAALPILALGAAPRLGLLLGAAFLAGVGTEVFSLGWSLAMQENVAERMLSRAYSYDMLGSFVAMPVGQLTYGPLGDALGRDRVLVASGVLYVAVCALVLSSRAVRTLPRRRTEPASLAA
jgi:MFS family permease